VLGGEKKLIGDGRGRGRSKREGEKKPPKPNYGISLCSFRGEGPKDEKGSFGGKESTEREGCLNIALESPSQERGTRIKRGRRSSKGFLLGRWTRKKGSKPELGLKRRESELNDGGGERILSGKKVRPWWPVGNSTV